MHHHETDEASPSPMWLPILGLSLFALALMYFVVRQQTSDDVQVTIDVAGEQAPEAPAPVGE